MKTEGNLPAKGWDGKDFLLAEILAGRMVVEGSDGIAKLLMKRRRRFDGPVRAEITQGRGRLLMACY